MCYTQWLDIANNRHKGFAEKEWLRMCSYIQQSKG